MRLCFLFLLVTITFSCASRDINYDRNKLLNRYSESYKTFVDNQEVDLEYLYLNKNNIHQVVLNKKSKHLNIYQNKPTKFFEIKNLNLDSLSSGRRGWNKNKIALIVINGIPLTEEDIEKTKIDTNAIESLNIISQQKLNETTTWCRGFDGDVLIINTK